MDKKETIICIILCAHMRREKRLLQSNRYIQETIVIKSMTGFGRGEQVNDDRKIVVEIKAVNHRFCDMNVKLPKKLNYLRQISEPA